MRSLLPAAWLAALTLAAPTLASSQTPSTPLTADEAVREALARNLDLEAARLTIEVARGRRLQAGRLSNPELELAYTDDFAFAAEGERTSSISFSQRFPITARLAREREVAGKEVEIAEAEVREFVRELVAEVQGAFYRVRALDERLLVNRELVASVRRVEETTRARLRAAEASSAEVSLLRIETLQLEQEAQRLRRERETAMAALRRLLGRGSGEDLVLTGELDPGPRATRMDLPPAALDGSLRPDLQAARKLVERAEADRLLARSEILEDWTIGLGYDRERAVFDAPIGVEQDSFLGLDLTIPIPLWNRKQGRIAAAAAALRRSRRARDALARRIREELEAVQARVRSLRATVEVQETQILPEAIRARDLFERGYRQGLVGLAETLQAQRQYNEVRALHLELLGELRQAAIELEAAAATNPLLQKPDSASGPGGTP